MKYKDNFVGIGMHSRAFRHDDNVLDVQYLLKINIYFGRIINADNNE